MNRIFNSLLYAALLCLFMPTVNAQSADAREKAGVVVDEMRFFKRLFGIAGINTLSDGELVWYEGVLADIIDEDNQHANLCSLHAMVAMQEAAVAVSAPQMWAEDPPGYDIGSLRDWLFTYASNGIVAASRSDAAYARMRSDLTHECTSKRFITALNPDLRMGSLAMLEQELCYREGICPPDPE